MKIKGVIFDVDGTLLDSMPVWMEAGERYLRSMDIQAEPGLGGKLFAMTMMQGACYLKEQYGLKKEVSQIVDEVNEVVRQFYLKEAALKPGTRKFLDWIKEKKIPAVIATSTDYDLIAGAFQRLGILGGFQKIFTCTQVGAGKEQPLIYYKGAEYMGTKPEETLVLEDALYGLQTAKKAGFITAGVYDTASEKQQRELHSQADLYGKSFTDILEKLKKKRRTVLTIAGSDSVGGAGIQADIKTMLANGVYAMSAVTALTAQNTMGVAGVMDVTPGFLDAQLTSVFEDIAPDAVKIGMVSSADLIGIIAEKLKKYRADCVVIDPVMVSSSGTRLLGDRALAVLREKLFPLADLITPNIPETEVLWGRSITDKREVEQAARELGEAYHCAVLCKGGHRMVDADDCLYQCGKEPVWFPGKRIDNPNTHGTGCTLSSAIAANLAKGWEMEEAVRRAKAYLTDAIEAALDLGKGSGPLDHGFAIGGEYGKNWK